jgi:flagellar hook assembly protein FlgD
VTTIRFDIPEGAANLLSLRIFDINGGLVETLMDGQREPGIYTVQWDGSDQPSGVYFIKIESSGFVQTKKMVLLK